MCSTDEFMRRVAEEWRGSVSESAKLSFGPVRYTDPLGAYAASRIDSETENLFTKTFRYAYQRERAVLWACQAARVRTWRTSNLNS